MNELVFMIFGLGFFLYVIHLGNRDNERDYNRWLNNAREFGIHPRTNNGRKFFNFNKE